MHGSVGEASIPYLDSWGMPPGLSMSREQWEATYRKSVEELARCCKDPKAAGCIVTPITGATP